MIKISPAQMNTLTSIFEQRYIVKLIECLKSWGVHPKQINNEVISDILQWLRLQKITDDRSIRGLFYLFCRRGCLEVGLIPTDFREILCDINEDGVFKAETLLIRELGNVPL